MKYKKLLKFLRKNYIIVVIILCISFVGLFIISRSLLSKPTYIYVKVKIGQGLWWSTGARPSIWHNEAVSKGDTMRDLLGNPQAIILGKRYYRWYSSDQYDVYLTLKVKVSLNKRTGVYTFNRYPLSIGSPIELQFPKEYFTGTVIEMYNRLPLEKYFEKTMYLTKRNALPWEFDAIQIGDSYFDGQDTVFKVVDKAARETTNISTDVYGNNNPSLTEMKSYITVKAIVKIKKVGSQLVMGEDQLIAAGRALNISTLNFGYSDYIISKIE